MKWGRSGHRATTLAWFVQICGENLRHLAIWARKELLETNRQTDRTRTRPTAAAVHATFIHANIHPFCSFSGMLISILDLIAAVPTPSVRACCRSLSSCSQAVDRPRRTCEPSCRTSGSAKGSSKNSRGSRIRTWNGRGSAPAQCMYIYWISEQSKLTVQSDCFYSLLYSLYYSHPFSVKFSPLDSYIAGSESEGHFSLINSAYSM
jgi:hypothetical protein